jgi:hypothetical protein
MENPMKSLAATLFTALLLTSSAFAQEAETTTEVAMNEVPPLELNLNVDKLTVMNDSTEKLEPKEDSSTLVTAVPDEAKWKAPEQPEVILLGVTTGLVVLDVWLSLDIKNHPVCTAPGCYDITEANPLLGKHPSDARLIGSAVTAMAVVGFMWYWNPKTFGCQNFWRRGVPIALFGVELLAVSVNIRNGLSINF